MALWVETHHGDAGGEFIASKIDQLNRAGAQDGARLWQDVARRYEQLAARKSHS
jgi:ribosomal protein L18E